MTTLAGVPTVIKRSDVLRMLETIGIEWDNLVSLRFEMDGIHAEVYALDENGKPYLTPNQNTVAKHRISISIVEDGLHSPGECPNLQHKGACGI